VNKQPKRIVVGTKVFARKVYPLYRPENATLGREVNILLTDDEALNLARHLTQAARVCKELTVKAMRKPAVKKADHHVTVTYEARMKK